jgi:hypothetical protein
VTASQPASSSGLHQRDLLLDRLVPEQFRGPAQLGQRLPGVPRRLPTSSPAGREARVLPRSGAAGRQQGGDHEMGLRVRPCEPELQPPRIPVAGDPYRGRPVFDAPFHDPR